MSACPRCARPVAARADRRRLLVDSAAGLGLLLALGLVFLVDRGSAGPGQRDSSVGMHVVESKEPDAPRRGPLRLAVTPPQYDDMGRLLDTLGTGYRYRTIAMDDLLSAERLGEHDVVFVTCGFVPAEWVAQRLRAGARDGGEFSAPRPHIVGQLKTSLRQFVDQGGTLYLSDWHYQLVAIAFPECTDESKSAEGAAGVVQAEVLDAGLRRRLGPRIELHFDKPGWRPAAFRGPQVTAYLSGTFRTIDGNEATAPLLVQFPFGGGNVIFTSFHNEKQSSDTEWQLLRYLVFATVTAQTDARIKRTMLTGGFSPVERNLLSASAESQALTQTYDCPGTRDLQFVLGFEDCGAELVLHVLGPGGPSWEKRGTSTFSIDIRGAEAGQYEYTVTPVRVPYENFPFTLTVGEKQ